MTWWWWWWWRRLESSNKRICTQVVMEVRYDGEYRHGRRTGGSCVVECRWQDEVALNDSDKADVGARYHVDTRRGGWRIGARVKVMVGT